MDITQDVKPLEAQSKKVDEENDEAIATGQAHLSPLRIRENNLHYVAFTERPTPQAGIVNNNGNTTFIMGNGAIVTNNNSNKIVQAADEQVYYLVKACE